MLKINGTDLKRMICYYIDEEVCSATEHAIALKRNSQDLVDGDYCVIKEEILLAAIRDVRSIAEGGFLPDCDAQTLQSVIHLLTNK